MKSEDGKKRYYFSSEMDLRFMGIIAEESDESVSFLITLSNNRNETLYSPFIIDPF